MYVYLEGLKTLNKFKKTTPVEATRQYFREGQEIASTIIKNYTSVLKVAKSSIFNPKSIRNSR